MINTMTKLNHCREGRNPNTVGHTINKCTCNLEDPEVEYITVNGFVTFKNSRMIFK